MCPATAAGWVSAMACEASISMLCAPARRAMNSWPPGGITWSAVATMYQLGAVFHAAAGDFSHLYRVFPKLGITSRTELRHVLDRTVPGRG
jgi:hypothetical protein